MFSGVKRNGKPGLQFRCKIPDIVKHISSRGMSEGLLDCRPQVQTPLACYVPAFMAMLRSLLSFSYK